MKIDVIEQDLHKIDEVRVDLIIASAFAEDRPFKGLAGLIDWRMCGPLSRLAIDKFLTGELREALLMPCSNRLPSSLIVVVGLGSRANFLSTAMAAFDKISSVIKGLKVKEILMDLPGLNQNIIGVNRAVKMFMDSMKKANLLQNDLHVYITAQSNQIPELRSSIKQLGVRRTTKKYYG